jgi:RHS repeat-associated protein
MFDVIQFLRRLDTRKLMKGGMALLCLLLAHTVAAQVTLPNGTYSESVEDLRVKVLGGHLVIDRQYLDGRWQIAPRWNSLKFTYDPLDSSVTSIDRNGSVYARQGDGWAFDKRNLIRRQSVSVLPAAPAGTPTTGIPGQDGQTLASVQGYRWLNRTGDWIDYDTEGRIAAYGDKNDVKVWFQYDAGGKLKTLLDHLGRIVLTYTWSGDLLTQIQDNPNLITGNSTPARVVKYTYNGTTPTTPTYPLLTQVTDVLGHNTAYTFEAGRIKTLTDPENRTRTLTYGPTGRINSVKEADGAETGYLYDYDKVKRQFYIRVTGPQAAAGQRIEETWYDSDGRIIRRDLNGKTQSTLTLDTGTRTQVRKDAAGQSTTTQTDEYDNPVKTTYPDGSQTSALYSAVHGQILEETDELGVKTAYAYDTRGNLTQKTDAAGKPEQRITEYRYDSYGQTLGTTKKGGPVTLPNGNAVTIPDATTTYEYDTQGNSSKITDAEGNATQYQYNIIGAVTLATDAKGQTWKATYDAKGHLLTRTDPLNQTLTASYNKVGERTQLKDALNSTTAFAYDARGRLIQTTDPLGNTRKQEYDAYDRPTAEIDEAGNRIREIAYDLDGRLTQTKDGNGNATAYVYGADGAAPLPTQIRFPTFTRELVYDSRSRNTETRDILSATAILVTKNAYDKKGNLTQITDKNGNPTQLAYDALSRLTQTTDAAGGLTKYSYDARDNLLAVTDPNGNTTAYAYDKNNRRTAETWPMGQIQTSTWGETGNLIKLQDAKGNQLQYTYDAANRRVEEKHVPAGEGAARTIAYIWNAAGALAGYTDTATGALAHSASYTLDALQRKTQETVSYGTHSFTSATTWTPTGQKASFTTPGGFKADYTFDANHQLASVTLPGGSISIAERLWEVPRKITYPGGSQQTRDYDALLRPTRIKVNGPDQATLLDRQYSFDAESNVTQKATEHGDYNYAYDSLYRLTRADQPSPLPQEAYTYDKLGNRLTDSTTDSLFATNTWSYNGNNQLTRHYSKQGQPVADSYDDNGSLIKKQSSSTDAKYNQQYRYDAQNRLVEVKDKDGNTVATYQYDPFGRRIGKAVYRDSQNQTLSQAQTTYFIYSDEGLVAEATAIGTVAVEYGWQPQGTWGTDPLFIRTTQTNGTTPVVFYYQNDHLGTPQKAIDSQGNVGWEMKALAFGEATVGNASVIISNLRFAGQYFDEETNTHYNWYRTYGPGEGRYMQSDPIGLEGGINLYAYVLGNPLSWVDPKGLANSGPYPRSKPGPRFPNGNYNPGFAPQDGVCTLPGAIGKSANSNSCILTCCKDHDKCYAMNGCNASSWYGNIQGYSAACQQCNTEAKRCISKAIMNGCSSCG